MVEIATLIVETYTYILHYYILFSILISHILILCRLIVIYHSFFRFQEKTLSWPHSEQQGLAQVGIHIYTSQESCGIYSLDLKNIRNSILLK